MNEEFNRGNFTFVEEIYPDVFSHLVKAEKYAHTDCYNSGIYARKAYETWMVHLVAEYKLDLGPGRNSLNDMRKELWNRKLLPQLTNHREFNEKTNRHDDWYTYQPVKGEPDKKPGYVVWQKYGNQCPHWELNPDDPDTIYANMEVVLRIAHEAMRQEYKRKKGEAAAKNIKDFDSAVMPIEDNYIVRFNKAVDERVTNCIGEYETISYTETGRVDKYGIVRVFDKGLLNERLLKLRAVEAFTEAEAEAGIAFDGNVRIDALSKMGDYETDHYVVIYEFTQKPERLNDALLNRMTPEEKIGLCKGIAKILNTLHTLSVPIYHRNISFDALYVCQNRAGKYEPSIIKFDCAKIDSKEFGTVIENVQNMQTIQAYYKYSSPEVRAFLAGNSIEIDWAKADIFALGVLFGDILNGKIAPAPVPAVKLHRIVRNIEMVQLIEKMQNPQPALRPTSELVNQIFEEMN